MDTGLKSNTVLEVRGLTKKFPGVLALNEVDFTLREGEVHALVGENGAGKSTLIQSIAGVQNPDGGQILLKGEPVIFSDPLAASRQGIGTVFQERSLSVNLSIAENIFANRQPLKNRLLNIIDRQTLRNQTAELLRLFKLDLDPDIEIMYLSAALQQVIEVLKAISLQPGILILDEPTSSLTGTEVQLLFENIRRLKREGMSFIYISHHLPEIFEIADRVTILRDGRHVHTCPVSEIDEPELVRCMVGRELEDLYGTTSGHLGDEVFRIENASRGKDFSHVSFSVRAGEIVGVAGLAGAGRTELCRGIFGLEPLDSGEMHCGGVRVSIDSPSTAISHGIAYLTEDRKEEGLFLEKNVRENCVGSSLGRFTTTAGLIDESAIDEFAAASRKRFNIVTPSLAQRLNNLSGGNQQKVLLAMCMGVSPQFLIVDEPTRGVDVGAKGEIYHRLRELAAEGVAILMVSSDLPEILGMSDRILVLRDGRIAAEITTEEATEELIIAHATGVDLEQGKAV